MGKDGALNAHTGMSKADDFIELLLKMRDGTVEEREAAMDKLFEMELERMKNVEK